MTHRELWERLQISERRFYELKAAGVFDKLISPIPYRYSRERVEAWIANRPLHPWSVAS